jgi:transposase
MSGKSLATADEEQREALRRLARSRERGEADRARAILLTLSGWTSPRIAEAFGVREDTVRLWRMDFARGGVEALKATVATGPPPIKTEAALRVVTPLLEAPVADRPNWTIARLSAEIEAQEGIKTGRSQLSRALRKKLPLAAAPAHAESPPGRRRDRARGLAPAVAQGRGRGRRHRSALWRRERSADASLSGAGLGQTRRGSARAGARPGKRR